LFVDSVRLTLSSGKGGAGCASFHQEKFITKGGPDGGDGGRGGDVYFATDANTDTLSNLKNRRVIRAKNGRPGMTRKKYGKSGESVTITVPPGTQIIDEESGEILLDLVENGQKIKFLEGGKGGLGNVHFKSSTNQKPTYAQPGKDGETKEVRLELKLIADVGLVGFPNVGKSTLISTISNSKAEIANYEFTTMTPNLGVVASGDYSSFVMADIPGIIEGASDGRGLGIEFLKHIERTKTSLFMIDLANYRDVVTQFETLKEELLKYSQTLSDNLFAIALTRADSLTKDEVKQKVEELVSHLGLKQNGVNPHHFTDELGFYAQDVDDFENGGFDTSKPFFIAPISSVVKINLQPLTYSLQALITYSKGMNK
jgi:GTP-binding protein